MLDETPSQTRQLVLIGGGHAHVAVLRAFGMDPLPGLRIILVSDHRDTPYSGMLPAHIAGHYKREEAYLDLNRLARFAGADFYCDRVTGLDLDQKQVMFAERPPVPFDLLSIDIGSTPAKETVPGAADYALPVKPIESFLRRWNLLINEVAEQDRPRRIVTVGGGAAGVELTLSAQHRLRQVAAEHRTTAPEFELITAAQSILETHNRTVQRTLLETCLQRGVSVRCKETVVQVEPGIVVTEDGNRVKFDHLFWTTHASAPRWIRDSGLQVSTEGFIEVDPCLRSWSHQNVFAAGDIANLTTSPRPKSGVFAVRQGLPLARNIRLAVLGFPPKRVRLQKSFLSLISTGDTNAVASKGRWSVAGHWVWKWKQHIDLKWMRTYRELPTKKTPPFATTPTATAESRRIAGMAGDDASLPRMRCGGSGAKVGALTLHEALKRIPFGSHPNLELGLNAPDDAAIVSTPPGKLLVQSVDYLPAFLSDPFTFGRIAANHALNNLFAMGAEPAIAQVTAIIPFNSSATVADNLIQLLGGVARQLRDHLCALAGGHTAQGRELGAGLTVNGFVDPRRVFRKTGLQPGDQLVLTKPLGTGIVLAADRRNRVTASALQSAIDSMLQSNQAVVAVLQRHGVTTATDVGGFGLIGHLREMFGKDDRLVQLFLDRIPLLPGAHELAASGIESSLKPANAVNHTLLNWPTPITAWSTLLFDPQTAGGLLAAVAPEAAESVVEELHETGLSNAAVIGEVGEGRSTRPILISGGPDEPA